MVHWSWDNWKSSHDSNTRDTGLGTHVVDLPTEQLRVGGRIVFTFYWTEMKRWEGTDFEVGVQ
jgi:glucoamylase